MEDMTTPDTRAWVRCWCLLVHHNYGGEVTGHVVCNAYVPPDQPFCSSCESRHPDLVSRLVTVTTRPLPV